MSLVQLCLKSMYFVFDVHYGTMYHQHAGIPMGSPILGLIAELVMQHFEELTLHGEASPRLWLRYVDDTFLIIKKADVDRFLLKINSTWPAIQFTCEVEQAGSLPFLDVHLSRIRDGKLHSWVYRKPTHMDKVLDYRSGHPTCHKISCVRSLVGHVKTHCSDREQR